MGQLYLHVYGWLYFRGVMVQLYLHVYGWLYFRGLMGQLYLHVYGWLYFRGLMGQLYLHGPADWFYFRGGWYSYICIWLIKCFLMNYGILKHYDSTN